VEGPTFLQLRHESLANLICNFVRSGNANVKLRPLRGLGPVWRCDGATTLCAYLGSEKCTDLKSLDSETCACPAWPC